TDEAQRLIRNYRRALCVPFLAEAVAVAGLLAWAGAMVLYYEQVAAFFIVAVLHSLTGLHFVRRVKERAADSTWQPQRTVALSLKIRRLADYTSVSFEAAVG